MHRQLTQLPEADVVVHSGDFTFSGSEDEAYDFMNWFCDLPYKHKIFIAGNHDQCMYGADKIEGLPENVHYLCNMGVTIDGVMFWGVPMFIEDCADRRYGCYIRDIPDYIDVLITHQPPSGICDLADYGEGLVHYGDPILAECIKKLHLQCHLFGHEHDTFGVEKHGTTTFSNGALVDSQYDPITRVPNVFEVTLPER